MRIALITGGSDEREISLRSAKNIEHCLSFGEVSVFLYPEQKNVFIKNVRESEVVVPVIHGEFGEDGEIQTLCEQLNIPYLFAGPEGMQKTLNKKTAKEYLPAGIKTAQVFEQAEDVDRKVIVKPLSGGSSQYIGICSTAEEVLNHFKKFPEIPFLIEEFIEGREFTMGVIEHAGEVMPLPVIEIQKEGDIDDFDSKYTVGKLSPQICPAEINDALTKELQELAVDVHKTFGLRHMSRTDVLVTKEGKIYFLEVNTIPGFTATSLVPKALGVAGIDPGVLFKEWIQSVL